MTKKVAIILENGFDYSGHKIDIDENGYFVTSINGTAYRSPSLVSLKRKLRGLVKIQTFDAYEIDRVTSALKPVKIQEIVSFGRGSKQFKTVDGRFLYSVVKAGPGVLKAYNAWRRASNKEEKRRAASGKVLEKLSKGFERINVYNFR